MRVGFTGTRNDPTHNQKYSFRLLMLGMADSIAEFHHGQSTGADYFAAEYVYTHFRKKIYVVSHPMEGLTGKLWVMADNAFAPRPPLERNQDIVDNSDILIAMPDAPEHTRSGTWATIRRARKKRLPIILLDWT